MKPLLYFFSFAPSLKGHYNAFRR